MANDPIHVEVPSLRGKVSPEEWRVRVDLAACYRLVHWFGWDHLVYNHISARVPGHQDYFLINPWGFAYEEITASSLVKLDLDGRKIDGSPFEVNEAGFVIHSAVHGARPDVGCVVHTHTDAGVAVSMLECGLLPLNLASLRFHGNVGYHDFEGPAVNLDERQRIVAALGKHQALILRNHGLLTVGRTIAGAFVMMFHLQKACVAQIMAMSTGQPLLHPSQDACEHPLMRHWRTGEGAGVVEWPAMLRRLDRIDPSYRD